MRFVVRHVDAELAHRIGMAMLQTVGAVAPLRRVVTRLCAPPPACATRVMGLDLRSPLGVAAGLDKNAHAVLGLAALGFGFVEVGTVTARPQPGNPRPRLVRLIDDRAIVNRMGFNNDGAAVVADRLRRLRSTRAGREVVLGVNVGRSKAAGPDETVDDYRTSTRLLAPYADYLTVNISSPNTPGLRDLHAAERLRPLLETIRSSCDEVTTRRTPLPILLKISPDLDDADVPGVAAIARSAGLTGLIATNTTVGRDGLSSSPALVDAAGGGGLSGRPLRERARRVQHLLVDGGVVVASGGVDSPDDAATRIADGAELVQAYTGFIYGGPAWPARVNRRLARR